MPEKKKLFGALVLTALLGVLAGSFMLMPAFGGFGRNSQVPLYYIDHAFEETGSANVVNSIVWDFRGYDTLGEETVLFAATVGIVLLVRRRVV